MKQVGSTTRSSVQVLIEDGRLWSRVEESVMSALNGEERSRVNLHVVLDMNGVLLFRETPKDRVHGPPRPCNFRLSGASKAVWLRPNLDVLLLYLFRRFEIGFWTSAMAKNAKPIIEKVLRPGGYSAEFVLTREHTLPDTDPRSKPYATIKDLSVLWDVRPGMNDRNTLIVDDTPAKTRLHPSNRVVVPEFDAKAVAESLTTDDVLLWLTLYVDFCALALAADGSVQTAVRELGFDEFVELGRKESRAAACLQRLREFDVNAELLRGAGDLKIGADSPETAPQAVSAPQEPSGPGKRTGRSKPRSETERASPARTAVAAVDSAGQQTKSGGDAGVGRTGSK